MHWPRASSVHDASTYQANINLLIPDILSVAQGVVLLPSSFENRQSSRFWLKKGDHFYLLTFPFLFIFYPIIRHLAVWLLFFRTYGIASLLFKGLLLTGLSGRLFQCHLEPSLSLSQWSSSGLPVAIQCYWNLDPSVHWNATGERIVVSQCVSSVLQVVFQWLSSGLPVCSNYAN